MPRPNIPHYITKRLNLESIDSSRRLLRLVDEHGRISQAEAAQALGLSTGACNLHFQRLEHEGLIARIDDLPHAGRGRPTMAWKFARNRNFCVTFTFNVPQLDAALVDFNGEVVYERNYDLSSTRNSEHIAEIARAFTANCQEQAEARQGRIRQVVASIPGLLDAVTGIPTRVVNFPALEGFDLPAIIARYFDLPCTICSHGIGYLLGETENVPPDQTAMVLYWEIGLNVIFGCNQRVLALQTGPDSRPLISEIGHVRIHKQGPLCHCGQVGCLEAFTGGWALIQALNKPGVTSLEQFVARTLNGDRQALALTRRAARLLGKHLAWPIQLMNVDRIIVTGPMAPAFAKVQTAFQQGLADIFSPLEINRFEVSASPAPRRNMLRGAYLLARQLFLNPEACATLPGTPQQLR